MLSLLSRIWPANTTTQILFSIVEVYKSYLYIKDFYQTISAGKSFG